MSGGGSQLANSFSSGTYKPSSQLMNGRINPLNTNGGYMQSIAELDANADGSMNMKSKLEQLKPYFGVPQRQVQQDPYQWWDTETHDLPDAFRGKNAYLLNIIITAILTTEMTPVTEMLPYKKNETELTVRWDEWTFNDSLLDRTPEESVSRMTTSTTSSNTQHLMRRGKAFMIEHGFWKTPMGQKNWAMNVVQIVNATNETACFGATHAILTADPYVDPNMMYNNRRQRGMLDVDSLMMEQTDGFARIQKEEGGLATTLRKMDETFRARNGHQANYVVLPSGCDLVVNNRPENNYAIYNGKGITNPGASSGYPWTTRTSRGYRIGEKSPDVDPHFTTVCVGGFHVLTNQAANLVSPADYRTQHRTVVIFSMNKDDFTPMELPHVFGYLGLYDNWIESSHMATCKLSHIGEMFLGKYISWGALLDAAGEKQRAVDKLATLSDDAYDMFMAKFQGPKNVTPKKAVDRDYTQPTLAASAASSSITRPTPDSLDSRIASYNQHHSGTYLAFIGNRLITCSRSLQCNAVGSAESLYNVAAQRFVHYDFKYGDATTLNLALKPSAKFDVQAESSKRACARVSISVSVSLVYSMLAYFNSTKHKSIDVAASNLCSALHKWLSATDDISTLISEGIKCNLIDFYATPHLDTLVHYTKMVQFEEQYPIRFDSIIAFLISISVRPFDAANVVMITAFKTLSVQALPTQGPTGDCANFAAGFQGGLRQSHSLTYDYLVKSNFRETLAVNQTEIKQKVESIILTLGNKHKSSIADQTLHLSGFEFRFNSFSSRIGRLYVIAEEMYDADNSYVRPTPQWYINVLLVAALKCIEQNTVALFLDLVADNMRDVSSSVQPNIVLCISPPTPSSNAEDFLESHKADIALFVADIRQQVVNTIVIKAATLTKYISAERQSLLDDNVNADLSAGRVQVGNILSLERFVKFVEGIDATFDICAKLEEPNFLLEEMCNLINCDGLSYAAHCVIVQHAQANEMLLILMAHSFHDALVAWEADPESKVTRAAERGSTLKVNMVVDVFKTLMTNPICKCFHELAAYNSLDAIAFKQALVSMIDTRIKGNSGYCILQDEQDAAVAEILNEGGLFFEPTFYKISKNTSAFGSQFKGRISGDAMSSFLNSIPLANGDWARYSFDSHIPFPVGAIGFRLHKQFDMGTAIMMDAYGQAGFTFFGHADFQLGDDIGKKVHIAHFTLYLKSVVMNSKLIVYARYVISRGYFGGEGTKIYDPLDNDDVTDFHSNRIQKDIMYAPVLSNFRAENNVMDVTGRFPADMCASSDANASIQYESADIMRRIWHFNHSRHSNIESGCTQPLHQTIAMQEHTQTWNNQTKGFTDVTLDKGHWGKNKYPGCGMVIKGDGRCLERTIHDQTKTMTIGI